MTVKAIPSQFVLSMGVAVGRGKAKETNKIISSIAMMALFKKIVFFAEVQCDGILPEAAACIGTFHGECDGPAMITGTEPICAVLFFFVVSVCRYAVISVPLEKADGKDPSAVNAAKPVA